MAHHSHLCAQAQGRSTRTCTHLLELDVHCSSTKDAPSCTDTLDMPHLFMLQDLAMMVLPAPDACRPQHSSLHAWAHTHSRGDGHQMVVGCSDAAAAFACMGETAIAGLYRRSAKGCICPYKGRCTSSLYCFASVYNLHTLFNAQIRTPSKHIRPQPQTCTGRASTPDPSLKHAQGKRARHAHAC